MNLRIVMKDDKEFPFENVKSYKNSIIGKSILVEFEDGKLENLNVAYAKFIYLTK